jgi:hypothetical protein
LIGKLTEVGKGRTAGELRSYLPAAYSLAIASKTDSDAPMVLHTFGVDANPVASVGAQRLSKYNRARNEREHAYMVAHYGHDGEPPGNAQLLSSSCLTGSEPFSGRYASRLSGRGRGGRTCKV